MESHILTHTMRVGIKNRHNSSKWVHQITYVVPMKLN